VILHLQLYLVSLENNSGKETSSRSRSGHQQHRITNRRKKEYFYYPILPEVHACFFLSRSRM